MMLATRTIARLPRASICRRLLAPIIVADYFIHDHCRGHPFFFYLEIIILVVKYTHGTIGSRYCNDRDMPRMPADIIDERRIRAKAAKARTVTASKYIKQPAVATDNEAILDSAKEKMRTHGIAPPEKGQADRAFLTGKGKVVPCPRCGTDNTHMVSAFGSTACKAHFSCKECLEPFEHFKCI